MSLFDRQLELDLSRREVVFPPRFDTRMVVEGPNHVWRYADPGRRLIGRRLRTIGGTGNRPVLVATILLVFIPENLESPHVGDCMSWYPLPKDDTRDESMVERPEISRSCDRVCRIWNVPNKEDMIGLKAQRKRKLVAADDLVRIAIEWRVFRLDRAQA